MGAEAGLHVLPAAAILIADKGYDSDALGERGITACIADGVNRKEPIACDSELDKLRHLIERMIGRLKDWRRIATR